MNKMTNIKTFILLISVSLIFPSTAQAASILYSVTGTLTDGQTAEIRSITGHMVISDVPLVNSDINNPTTDSSILYTIETSVLDLEGFGSATDQGLIRFEWDGGGTFGGFIIPTFGDFMLPRVQFFDSVGTPYDALNFAEFAVLAPLITSSGGTGHFGAFNTFGLLDLKLTAVPVPAAVWLFTSGLIGLIGLARRKA